MTPRENARPHMGTPDTTCTLHLIRHGETEWNRDGRWQGQTDVPLGAAGRTQAERLARRLVAERARFDALYSSDLSRAWQTAEAVGSALGLSLIAAPALREVDLGCWSGRTAAQIAAEFPQEWSRLEAGEDIPRGGGETYAAFLARVRGWIDEAADRHPGGRICVVTHGGCVRAALLAARGLTWAERRAIPAILNASVSILRRTHGRWETVAVNQVMFEPEGPPLVDADEDKVL